MLRMVFNLILIGALLALPAAAAAQDDGNPIRILWTTNCDPRLDPEFCNIDDSLAILEPFYNLLDELNATLDYGVPLSEADLAGYDVVVMDFCELTMVLPPVIDLLSEYVAAGGSAVVMGTNACVMNDTTAAQAASSLTRPWGIVLHPETANVQNWAIPVVEHPLTRMVTDRIFAVSVAMLSITDPAQVLYEVDGMPVMAIYEETGTAVVIPLLGFQWTSELWSPLGSRHRQFWSRMFTWLAEQSRAKLDWSTHTSADLVVCLADTNEPTGLYTAPGTDGELMFTMEWEGLPVSGQTTAEDGVAWIQLWGNYWVSNTDITLYGACDDLPGIE